MNNKKIISALVVLGFVLCLIQIWVPAFFLTGDGPCHVNNAQILHDFWCGKNVEFYSRFFQVSYQPNPNWMATFVIALLIFVVKGVVAEKIFLSIYVILYASGFYLLLGKAGSRNSFWLLVVFVFIFTTSLSKGFYNFTFSIAFYFWVVWTWLRFMEKKNWVNASLFFLFNFLIFFTHLLAFTFSCITCASLVLSYALSDANLDLRAKTLVFIRNMVWLLLLLLPFLVLMHWFTEKEGGLQIHLGLHRSRIFDLIDFKYIINVREAEVVYARIAGISLIGLMFVSFIFRAIDKRIHRYDGFFLSLLFLGFVYMLFPEEFMGHLILITVRAQLFVFILMACCISYMLPLTWLKNAAGVLLFGCFIALSVPRFLCQESAAKGVSDYVSGIDSVKPYSVILPLDFSPNGRDFKGEMITDKNWLFVHAAQYMGTMKPCLVLDNYEANLEYFPLVWKQGVNPYNHLSRGQGIESQPPFARIAEYNDITGVKVDYVAMWCYNDSFLADTNFNKLYKEINRDFHVLHVSKGGRSILYGRN